MSNLSQPRGYSRPVFEVVLLLQAFMVTCGSASQEQVFNVQRSLPTNSSNGCEDCKRLDRAWSAHDWLAPCVQLPPPPEVDI